MVRHPLNLLRPKLLIPFLDSGKEILHQMAPLAGFPVPGAPLFAVRLGWDVRWGDTHRQLSEQAVLVQDLLSQQSTNGEVAEQWCYPFAPVALSG